MTAIDLKARRPQQVRIARRAKRAGRVALDLSFIQARPIVTRSWAKLSIVLVGCGGTGSWLAPHLARVAYVLAQEGRAVSLTFIDPDHVESKNIPRQHFSQAELGANKARALALRYGAAWLQIVARAEPFKGEHLVAGGRSDKDLTLLVGCVDNAQARKAIAHALQGQNTFAGRDHVHSAWWLDCGNSRDGGQVLLGCASNLRELEGAFEPTCRALPSPALQRPELLHPLPEETIRRIEADVLRRDRHG